MRWFRITRYNPEFRDERGAYTRATWTSVSDVGKTFDDEVLLLEEYERVEQLYLDAVRSFAAAAGVATFEATKVGGGNGPDGAPLEEGQRLTLDEASHVVRSMLREEAWCQLQGVDVPFAVHVGYDLYMFVGTSGRAAGAVRAVSESGLFVDEDFLSPYAEAPTLADVRTLLDRPVATVDDLAGLVATLDDAVAARIADPGWDLAGWMLASASEDLEITKGQMSQAGLAELPSGEFGSIWVWETVRGLSASLDAWLGSDGDGPRHLTGLSTAARDPLETFAPQIPFTLGGVQGLRGALARAWAESARASPTRWLLRHVLSDLDVVESMAGEGLQPDDQLPDDPAERFGDALDAARFAVLGIRPARG